MLTRRMSGDTAWIAGLSPAMTTGESRHCEERSDEAIQPFEPESWIASLRSQKYSSLSY
jgi:hypothetical protein